jgi:hypothetical protein
MHLVKIVAFLLLVLAAPLEARHSTDLIVLANGDHMTGEIKGLSKGVLRIDLDYVDGTISVQWSKVARVESKQLFIVEAQDGSLYTGTLATSPGPPNRIEVGETQAKILIEQSQVVQLEETSATFLQRWSGEIDLGIVYSKGNNAIQNTLGTEVAYQRERWGARAAYNSSLSSNSGSATSTRNQLDLTGYHLLRWKNYYYGGLASFLQSTVQGISLQTTLGGGIGRYLKNTNLAKISVLGGIALQRTNYESSIAAVGTQQVGAGLIATNLSIFVFKKTNLSLSAYLIPSFTDHGRVRFNTNASYYLKLFNNFSWNFSFYGNWDTRPPGNFAGADYGYSSGVKWTFGYR